MKTIAILAAAACLALATENRLTGRWEGCPDAEDGAVMGALFGEGGNFNGSCNGRAFADGNYAVKGDTLSFTDNTCMGVEARYRLLFFSNGDSLRLLAISNGCEQRRTCVERTVLGRVKETGTD